MLSKNSMYQRMKEAADLMDAVIPEYKEYHSQFGQFEHIEETQEESDIHDRFRAINVREVA